jgi:hypothetical protein
MPSTRKNRSSCAPGATDEQLHALFSEMDMDHSGTLSIGEMTRALQTNGDFARVCTGNAESKPLPAMAARLIAQNIQSIFDAEFGDGDGAVSPDEFVMLCRRLMGEPTATSKGTSSASALSRSGGSSSAASKSHGSQGKSRGGFLGFGSRAPNPRESHAEARLFGLQSTLRTDVVPRLEALLTRASALTDAESKAALYYEGVTEALTACRRMADTAGDDDGAAPASIAEADALELQMLRREAADAKLSLADERARREAAEHELRVVVQQAGHPRSRSRSTVFGS